MDFQFLQNPLTKNWMILAPRRSKRPDVARGIEPVCPFCPGKESNEREVYRISGNFQSSVLGSQISDPGSSVVGHSVTGQPETDKLESENRQQKTDNWLVRVLSNKFPFAPNHEIVIHSPDHDKNFDKLPKEQVALILKAYRQRFQTHKDKGHVYIFHNHGMAGGESLPHPHTQLAVIPSEVELNIPRLDSDAPVGFGPDSEPQEQVETSYFYLFCPKTSQWPDEVWVAPKKRGRSFGEITDEEIQDFSFVVSRLIQIFDLRHGNEFPFNFYIYPGGDWYLRLIPRLKSLGGFEIGTGIFINTQDPKETIEFIKTHFENPDEKRIIKEHQAGYGRSA